MESLKKLAALLDKIERSHASERAIAIGQLQDAIWEDDALQAEELYFLQELAGDLNFYEPVEKDRDTGLGYYDDDRLMQIITAAKKRIEDIIASGAGQK